MGVLTGAARVSRARGLVESVIWLHVGRSPTARVAGADAGLQIRDSYLTGVQWVDEATVAVTSMSRALTSAQVSLCTAPAWHCSEVYAAANWRWVSELQPVFATGYSDFVVKTDDTEEHGEEMVEVMVQEGVKIRSKASGHRIVTLQFWDRQEHGIYYTGVEDTRPSETHLYWRPDSAAGQRAGAACLTCGVSTLLGRPCSRLTPIFGPNSDALALECAHGPVRSLHVLDRAVTRRLAELDSSRALAERMAVPHVFSETVSLGGEYVRLELILPALWEEKKGGTYLYPFVLDIEDDVLELDWSVEFATFMVSKWDLVFVRARATAQLSHRSFFGNQKRTSGILSHLSQKYQYLNMERIAVIGEGFGGHSALTALADNALVHCGAVLWPVVELDLYDAYHAERYVDTTNILDAIERIDDHSLYLVYGTGDPLFLHGDLLSKKLVERGVLFYQQIYSDEDVYFRSVRSHLHRSLEDFLIPKCFPHLMAKQTEDE
ncbi:uncharacterized protein LOC119100581 [Pollicipes pollicipes]|uniref:uncharacterized protein LOC119100581 n=1 Tax=Pollicipes pollicipes TaxID=41117 RepID=UPI001884A448|nr:uncharacterized protein LOC119100581 [Pollicipes pollicipes]